MGQILQRRLHTDRAFGRGEEIMLALGLATADLAAFPEAVLRQHGLTHSQYNVLRMLAGARPVGLLHGEITERLIMGVPDVTRLMDRLEKDGLARRERLAEDRRKVAHHITDAGLRLLARIQPELDRFHAWLEDALPRDSARTLVALCERLIAHASNHPPTPEASP